MDVSAPLVVNEAHGGNRPVCADSGSDIAVACSSDDGATLSSNPSSPSRDGPLGADKILEHLENMFSLEKLRHDSELLQAMNGRMLLPVTSVLKHSRLSPFLLSVEDIIAVGKTTKTFVLEENPSGNFLLGPLPFAHPKSRTAISIEKSKVSAAMSTSDERQSLTIAELVPNLAAAQALVGAQHKIFHFYQCNTSNHLIINFEDDKVAKQAFLDLQQKSVSGVKIDAKIRIENNPVTYSNQTNGFLAPMPQPKRGLSSSHTMMHSSPLSGGAGPMATFGMPFGAMPFLNPSLFMPPFLPFQMPMQPPVHAPSTLSSSAAPFTHTSSSSLLARETTASSSMTSDTPPSPPTPAMPLCCDVAAASGGSSVGTKYRLDPYSSRGKVVQVDSSTTSSRLDGSPVPVTTRNDKGEPIAIDDWNVGSDLKRSVGRSPPSDVSPAASGSDSTPITLGADHGGSWKSHSAQHTRSAVAPRPFIPHPAAQEQRKGKKAVEVSLATMDFPSLGDGGKGVTSADGGNATVSKASYAAVLKRASSQAEASDSSS